MISSLFNLKSIFAVLVLGGIATGSSYYFGLKDLLIPTAKADEPNKPGTSDTPPDSEETSSEKNEGPDGKTLPETGKGNAEEEKAEVKTTVKEVDGKLSVVFGESDKDLFDSQGKLQINDKNLPSVIARLSKLADSITAALDAIKVKA